VPSQLTFPFTHTYSIVARDPESGALGAAVQSHYFSVGLDTIFVEAGIGAIASQAWGEPAHGYRGLDLLDSGLDADATLRALISVDPGAALRQVAMVDRNGSAAAHTGERCIRFAGHHMGEGYSVQANMMLTDRVVPAMGESFESSSGPLEERLMLVLEAAEAAGGDIRGRQSATIRVAEGVVTGRRWDDVRLDLRVEDHAEPLRELRRLLDMHRAYELMRKADVGDASGEADGNDPLYEEAMRLAPGNLEIRFWHAFSVLLAGRHADAARAFAPLFEADPRWAELLRRLPEVGLASEQDVTAVLRQTNQK
jgi:uncharacterized Ntn-hydrolase superfamily protein